MNPFQVKLLFLVSSLVFALAGDKGGGGPVGGLVGFGWAPGTRGEMEPTH